MIKTYQESINFLYELRLHGTKLGLENITLLTSRMGSPHDRLKFIHIAGTNGKGSVAAMIESILRSAGFKTGLFTSPHLCSFTERIQINRVPISREDVVALTGYVGEFAREIESDAAGRFPTFFEFITAMALEQFAREQVDFVVWETGMGGRMDATNIITPEVSVITSVAFDHMHFLGDTLGKIAREKAGIIKPQIPCVIGRLSEEAHEVIRQIALKENAPLIESSTSRDIASGLKGRYQLQNVKIAQVVAETLRSTESSITDDAIEQGLRNASWPGRFTVFQENPRVIIDGAHNPSAMSALVDSLRVEYPSMKFTFIFGALEDKKWQEMLSLLIPLAQEIYFVPVQSGRTENPANFSRYMAQAHADVKVREFMSLEDTLPVLKRENTVICGSLFLVGEALWRLGVLPERDHVELNEKI